MSIQSIFQNLIRALNDPLGVVVIVGSAVFLYVLWIAIRDSGPRGPRKPPAAPTRRRS